MEVLVLLLMLGVGLVIAYHNWKNDTKVGQFRERK